VEDKQREETQGTIDTLTIFTLLVRCPTGGSPSDSCPFAPLRDKHTLEEKFRLAESLPQNKRQEMLSTHNQCLAEDYAKEPTAN
jgi:hypothetical protein